MRAPRAGEPLFSKKCPVIGVTGEIFDGKTYFGLSINPDPETTLYYDLEKSGESYEDEFPGLERVDVLEEMASAYPKGYRPFHLWLWWLTDLSRRVKSDKYRTVFIDPVSELEDGLEACIRREPAKYGLSPNQLAKSAGLLWGVMKSEWKSVLSAVAAKAECLVYSVHMRNKWKGNAPTGQREARGKETIRELASLFVELKRPVRNGERVGIPSAKVIKSRLLVREVGDDGNAVAYPVLPDYLPKCTPAHIRWYMENPIGVSGASEEERLPEEPEASEVEVLALKNEILTRQAENKALDLELDRRKELAAKRRQSVSGALPTDDDVGNDDDDDDDPTDEVGDAKEEDTPGEDHYSETGAGDQDSTPRAIAGRIKPTGDDGRGEEEAGDSDTYDEAAALELLLKLRDEALQNGLPPAKWKELLRARNCTNEEALAASQEACRDLIYTLATKLDLMEWADELYKRPFRKS